MSTDSSAANVIVRTATSKGDGRDTGAQTDRSSLPEIAGAAGAAVLIVTIIGTILVMRARKANKFATASQSQRSNLAFSPIVVPISSASTLVMNQSTTSLTAAGPTIAAVLPKELELQMQNL